VEYWPYTQNIYPYLPFLSRVPLEGQKGYFQKNEVTRPEKNKRSQNRPKVKEILKDRNKWDKAEKTAKEALIQNMCVGGGTGGFP
jgi:hypothetical protein